MIKKYSIEFILASRETCVEAIKNSLLEFGENLEVSVNSVPGAAAQDYKIKIHTEDPTLVFDTCGQFGRLRSVKVE